MDKTMFDEQKLYGKCYSYPEKNSALYIGKNILPLSFKTPWIIDFYTQDLLGPQLLGSNS